MTTKTTNLNLTKPGLDDSIELSVLNENYDTIDAAVGGKVDKEEGKGLSSNDFTDAEKTKLSGLENYIAAVSSQAAINKTTLGYQTKNHLKLTAAPATKNGVSFTVADGVVTLSGTATANADCYFPEYPYSVSEAASWLRMNEKSVLSCYGTFGSVAIVYYAPSVTEYVAANRSFKTITNGEPLAFEAGSIIIGIYLKVVSGTNYTGNTLSIMLRSADITDSTYEPYRPSVEERLAALEAAVMGGGVT